jgi:hypothetical protein
MSVKKPASEALFSIINVPLSNGLYATRSSNISHINGSGLLG